MSRALSIAATGMSAQQLNVDVIANNIANINTTAYKRQRAEFSDLLYQNIQRVGTSSSDANTVIPTGIQLGLGVNTGAVYRIHETGQFTQTSNPLDIAVQGKGYFRIILPSGDFAYTRAGNFQPNASGEIVNSQGYIVSPGLTIPANSVQVTVNTSGQVYATLQGQSAPQLIGQLDLVTFVNEAGLHADGDNLYSVTDASGPEITGIPGVDGVGTMLSGFLESSNVDPVRELTTLITAQRGYEMNSKVIQAADGMLQTINNVKQ